jgi:hypothetical protein
LPAITAIDYEAESQKERIQILEELDAKAQKALTPIYYSWVNITCHDYLFETLNLDPMQMPNVLFYHPGKNIYATTIGSFNKETIGDHEERFLRGNLPTVSAP